jgi:tripartite-type tricarboxylate transporter receptor subunit TctC
MAIRLSGSAAWAVLVVGALLALACARAAPASAPPAPAAPAAQTPAQAPAAGQAGSARPAAPAGDPSVEGFYRGQSLKLIVGFGAGGGFDTYTRLVARKLGDYIPGRPTVVVENMAGAGSLRAAQYIASVAPRNGTEMAVFVPGLILGARVGQQGVDFDPRTLNWIGNPVPEKTVCTLRSDLGFATFQQAVQSGRTLPVGASGTGGENWYVPKLLEAAGLGKWNVVTGYDGTNKIRLAVEQGEVDGVCSTGLLQSTPHWFEGDPPFARLVLQTGKTRAAELPNVPTWRELGVETSLAAMYDTAEALDIIARPFAMPPGVPADRLAAVRRAWLEAWKDPDVVATATQARFDVAAQGHETIEAGVQTIMALPDSEVPRVRELFGLQ